MNAGVEPARDKCHILYMVYEHCAIMPTILVDIPEPLRGLADGAAELPASGSTVDAALADLGMRYRALTQRVLTRGGAMREYVNLFLNDSDIRAAEGLKTPVREGDVLMIVPSVAGG